MAVRNEVDRLRTINENKKENPPWSKARLGGIRLSNRVSKIYHKWRSSRKQFHAYHWSEAKTENSVLMTYTVVKDFANSPTVSEKNFFVDTAQYLWFNLIFAVPIRRMEKVRFSQASVRSHPLEEGVWGLPPSSQWGGVPPSQARIGGTPHPSWWYPHWDWMKYSPPHRAWMAYWDWMGTFHQNWMGVPPPNQYLMGSPPPRKDGGQDWMRYHHWDWMGYSPLNWDWKEYPRSSGLDGGTPPPPGKSGDRAAIRRVVCLLRSHRRTVLFTGVFIQLCELVLIWLTNGLLIWYEIAPFPWIQLRVPITFYCTEVFYFLLLVQYKLNS